MVIALALTAHGGGQHLLGRTCLEPALAQPLAELLIAIVPVLGSFHVPTRSYA